MTLRVSDTNSDISETMRQAMLSDHTDMDFLVASGLLDIRFDFRPIRELLRDRKSDRLVDLRGMT